MFKEKNVSRTKDDIYRISKKIFNSYKDIKIFKENINTFFYDKRIY